MTGDAIWWAMPQKTKIGVNRQVQALMPKSKNHNNSKTTKAINSKFERQVDTKNYTSWVAILKNTYDIITPPAVVQFG